jgi:hypothetical protein
MGASRMEQNESKVTQYLTQKEVASKFRVTQSTVKNWREKGLLKYFQAPGSRRVIYPIDAVEALEQQSIKINKEVVAPRQIQRKRPETSTRPEKEWRV